ncbi:exonuclease domain-containing protein [Nocardia alni]|uniref:exonuclease domain-containing protein n=1 Tax=Nocardia alni TaxID=2815723 RepID=UPI0020B42513|nr:exonuclease domain-containing protein [Nocardia alni]
MTWTTAPLAAFDLETTGPEPLDARIVTACIVSGHRVGDLRPAGTNWLLDPEIEIPRGACAVHGVTTARARAEGQDYAEGYREIRSTLETEWALGHVLAIYNAVYDLTIINVEGLRLGYRPLIVGPVIDAFVVDRYLDKYRRGKRTLAVTCGHYGVRLDNAHSSDGDAYAALELARSLARTFRHDLEDITYAELMTVQAQWHKARQDSFRAYLQSSGKDGSGVCSDWPMRTA